jgi:hypothetical protein
MECGGGFAFRVKSSEQYLYSFRIYNLSPTPVAVFNSIQGALALSGKAAL